RLSFGFVVAGCGAIGKACQPFRCSPTHLRASSRFVAFLTGNSGKKPIYKFHQIAGEIWKKSIAEDSSARGKSECERRLTTTARRENFPRRAIGAYRNERRSGGSGEPGKFIVVVAFEFCIHVRASAH